LVDKNNEQVSNAICADKVKDLDKEKKCSKGLEALVKMNKENIEKIDDFYKLHDNFGKFILIGITIGINIDRNHGRTV